MSDITFTIIKPEVVEKRLEGEIIDKIVKSGFRITAMKLHHLTIDEAIRFYQIHEGKPYFNKLINYMSSAPVVVAVISKKNAVPEFRDFIGNTDPATAEEGTIRKLFGTNITINAIHGSDSDENALIESHFFFSELERF
jgi:nucleoside-diphosphate kinase